MESAPICPSEMEAPPPGRGTALGAPYLHALHVDGVEALPSQADGHQHDDGRLGVPLQQRRHVVFVHCHNWGRGAQPGPPRDTGCREGGHTELGPPPVQSCATYTAIPETSAQLSTAFLQPKSFRAGSQTHRLGSEPPPPAPPPPGWGLT